MHNGGTPDTLHSVLNRAQKAKQNKAKTKQASKSINAKVVGVDVESPHN